MEDNYRELETNIINIMKSYTDKIDNIVRTFEKYDKKYKFLIDLEYKCKDIIKTEMEKRFDKAQEFVEANLKYKMHACLKDLINEEQDY